MKYKLQSDNAISKQDINALIEWLKTYPQLTMGPLTPQVQQKWADYIGTQYAVFCNSGSSANLLMFAALIESGKLKNNKAVVPSVGWVTTVAPAIQLGLQPIMVGADETTYGIDLDQLESICIKENPAIVIFVQVLGVPHYRNRLLELKEKYGFYLLEDACAALGSTYENGIKVGTIGDMSSFSFYFGHQLSTIEGGMVNTNDKELYDTMLMLRSHGWLKDLDKTTYDRKIQEAGIDPFHKPFTFFLPGYNLRSTDLQAFIGLLQIDRAEEIAKTRDKNHKKYMVNLVGKVNFQIFNPSCRVASISFGCLAESKDHRTKIVENLNANGIETRIFSAGNLGRHPFWVKKYGVFNDIISDRIHDTGFFLPNNVELTCEDIAFISDKVKEVL